MTAAIRNERLPARLYALCLKKGLRGILLAAMETLFRPLVRHNRRLIWEARLDQPRTASVWEGNERLTIVGPDNLAGELTGALRDFLGASRMASEIKGLEHGDRLFVVTENGKYLAYSFIFFNITSDTRRQARILGVESGTPIIGLSFTEPSARGRGIYRRILNEMFRYLACMGYIHAVCEVDPSNDASNRASQAAGMLVRRELRDWMILRRILIQRVQEPASVRWRLAWVLR